MPENCDPSGEFQVDAVRAELERRLSSTPQARPAAPPEQEPPQIPDHAMLRRIGGGSYGEVWLARNTLGTLRAVKVVYRARFQDDRPFEREFHGILKYEPVSRTHEGLVHVLHAGRNELAGYFFYIMELADTIGAEPAPPSTEDDYRPRTLRSELASRRRLAPAEAASIVLKLAGAVGHLHARGLVHRDIKPGNVIFVGGRPKLADIGLVTDAGDSRSFVGTEGFIPPEGPGTPQADIFGLGRLLYELATGRDRMEFPDLPADLETLPTPEREALLELNEILARACAPDARKRYGNATALQADLNLFLAGHSLRRARATERSLARLRQLGLAGALLLAAAGVALWLALRSQLQAVLRAQTEAALRSRAEDAERASRQQLYTALLEQARATLRSGERGQRVRTLDAIQRAAAITNTPELRREAFAALGLPDVRLERTVPRDSGSTMIEPDPAFERVALGKDQSAVEIRSLFDQRLLATLQASTNRPVYGARWSKDGRFLVVRRDLGGFMGPADLEVWDVTAPRRVALAHNVSNGSFATHPLFPALLAGRGSGVGLWSLDQGNLLAELPLSGEPIHLGFSPTGTEYVAVVMRGAGCVVSTHRFSDGGQIHTWTLKDLVYCVEWHPAGTWIAVADNSGAIHLLDPLTGEARILGSHKAAAVLTLFSPDGEYLITAGWERELSCWEMHTRSRAFVMALDSFEARFSADGRRLAIFQQNALKIHAFERPSFHREIRDPTAGRWLQAAFSPDGRWLAASSDRELGVWDLPGGGPGYITPTGASARVFFTPDSSRLLVSRDRAALGWQLRPAASPNEKPVLESAAVPVPEGFVSLCLSGDALVLITKSGSAIVREPFDAPGGFKPKPTASGLSGASPDGRWLGIHRTFDPVLHVYSLPGLEPAARLTNSANIGDFKFSPLGDEVAVGSKAGITFWSTATWQATRFVSNFVAISFAPRAKGWWLTQDFNRGGLYEQESMRPLLPLPSGTLPLAIDSEGQFLAVAVDTRRLQVWNMAAVRKQFQLLGIDWADP